MPKRGLKCDSDCSATPAFVRAGGAPWRNTINAQSGRRTGTAAVLDVQHANKKQVMSSRSRAPAM